MFQEGLTAVTFNAAFYLDANADLQTAFGNLSGDALDARLLQHFVEFGQFEGRDPNEFFDTSFYLAENGDVLAAIGNPANTAVTSAFQHFVTFGAAEGVVRAPSAPFESFNAETYLAANPDLQAAFASVPAAQLPNVLFQHFVTFGVNEDRPGTGLDEGSQLAAQLEALAAANADVDAALEDAALLFNAAQEEPLDVDDVEPFTVEQLEAALDLFAAQVTEARAAAAEAQLALDNDRDTAGDDAALNAELSAARTAVRGETQANSLVNARTNAETALANDVAADGSNVEVLEGIQAAINAFVTSRGSTETVILRGEVSTGFTVGSLRAAIEGALGEEGTEAAINELIADLGGAGSLSLAPNNGGSTAANTALTTELNVGDQRADLIAAVATAEGNLEAARDDNLVVDRFLDAEEAIDAREGLIQDVADAQETLSDALDLLAGLREFQAVVDARDELLTDIEAEFGPITELEDGLTVDTADTDEDDIFFFDVSGSDVDVTITNFGDAGADVIFVGRGFTAVEIAGTVNFEGTAQGNVNALEIFVQQTDAGALLWIESETFDGSTSTGEFGGSQILLAGVDADDVVLDANGFIRLSPEAEALV